MCMCMDMYMHMHMHMYMYMHMHTDMYGRTQLTGRCVQAPLLLKRQANLANTTDAVLPHRAPALPKLA